MAIKIMIDAGHYTKYNQWAYKSYYEGDMTFKLQTYLKTELESYGFYVGVTKTSVAQDLSLSARGQKAKGYDLFLSLHSNACSTPSVKRVVIIKGYDQGDTLAAKQGKLKSRTCSNGIFRTMGEVIVLTIFLLIDYLVPNISFMLSTFIAGFIFKEGLSIIENLIKLDVYIPSSIKKMLEVGIEKIEKGEN